MGQGGEKCAEWTGRQELANSKPGRKAHRFPKVSTVLGGCAADLSQQHPKVDPEGQHTETRQIELQDQLAAVAGFAPL